MRRILGFTMLLASAVIAVAQDTTQPPAGQHEVFTAQGRGVQIYTCRAGAQWQFVAPAARLFNKDGVEVGTHGDGPVWHLQDGSSVLGVAVQKSPSPSPQAVPWLLLKASRSNGGGVASGVEYIRRSETNGGVEPASGCDAQHRGDLVRIPYSATYTFYSSK